MRSMIGWLIITFVGLAFIGFAFIAFDEAMVQILSFATDNITNADSVNTLSFLTVAWNWLPVVVLFAYIVYMVDKSQKNKVLSGVG